MFECPGFWPASSASIQSGVEDAYVVASVEGPTRAPAAPGAMRRTLTGFSVTCLFSVLPSLFGQGNASPPWAYLPSTACRLLGKASGPPSRGAQSPLRLLLPWNPGQSPR